MLKRKGIIMLSLIKNTMKKYLGNDYIKKLMKNHSLYEVMVYLPTLMSHDEYLPFLLDIIEKEGIPIWHYSYPDDMRLQQAIDEMRIAPKMDLSFELQKAACDGKDLEGYGMQSDVYDVMQAMEVIRTDPGQCIARLEWAVASHADRFEEDQKKARNNFYRRLRRAFLKFLD